MWSDPYKTMTIAHNHLNLPRLSTWTGGGFQGNSVEVRCDAAGTKLRKTVKTGVTVNNVQDYIGGIEYRDNVREAIYTAEGRVFHTSPTTTRYEYTIKDHLGNARLSFSDLNGNGAVDVTAAAGTNELLQENHYYPFGLGHDGPWVNDAARDNRYQYNGKEINDDFGLNWYNYGKRWYDAAVGRWWSVDPHAVNYLAWTPYNYVGNNSIIRVDPDGKDWYEDGDGNVVWFNKRDANFTDDDKIQWANIGEEYIHFGGKNLLYYTQNEDEEGNLSLETHVFEAVSGRASDDETFDYSDERQADKGKGPIPEGDYYVEPGEVQKYSDLSVAEKAAALVGKGPWPWGKHAWGENSVWITPPSVEVEDPETGEIVTRNNMSIHGGAIPGSAGCIDCHKSAPGFFKQLGKSKALSIRLRVQYSKNK